MGTTEGGRASEGTGRLEALTEITRHFAEATADYPQLLRTVVERTARFLDGYVFLGLVSDDGKILESAAEHADDPLLLLDVDALVGPRRWEVSGDSLVSLVVRTGKATLIADLSAPEWLAKVGPTHRPIVAQHNIQGVACVPMQARGIVIGTLSVGRHGPEPRPLEPGDVDLLQVLADHAAQALVCARHLRRLEVSAARAMALAAITQTFAEATTDYAQLVRTVVEQTSRFMGDYCRLCVVSDDGTCWQPIAHFAQDPALAADLVATDAALRFALDEPTLTARVVRTGEPLLIQDVRAPCWEGKLPPELLGLAERNLLRGFVTVAMRSQGKILGCLGVASTLTTFDAQDVALLQVIGDHAALALANARLLDDVQRELAEHKRTRASLERAEDKLRQAAKMEAIGRLAGGVAHDFNNILCVVLSYSDIVLGGLHPDDPLRRDLTEIKQAGERAADLTRQLLAFSRQQVSSPRVLDLNKVIAGVESMLRRLLGADVEVRSLPAADLFLCKIDPGQVEQVLMNLVVNARDAMPEGGAIVIETGNALLDEAYVGEHPEASVGPHVVLAVSDTGMGMDHETLARIFEPFFTTKAMGVGTGLGLATVYGIVKQAGGCVWVYSEPGKGTTFKVYLPRAQGDETQASPAPAEVSDLRGTETVLLVEDEEGVRRVMHGILARAGYHVIDASNGGEALLVCEQHGAKIALLLTDVVMPRLNGRKLAERLLQIRPELKVLYMSGYTENAIVHHGVLDSGIEFLAKPVTPDALLRKVREVLGPRRA